jgi:hypothetical protein
VAREQNGENGGGQRLGGGWVGRGLGQPRLHVNLFDKLIFSSGSHLSESVLKCNQLKISAFSNDVAQSWVCLQKLKK